MTAATTRKLMREFQTNSPPRRSVSVTACCRFLCSARHQFNSYILSNQSKCSNIRFTKSFMQGLVELHGLHGRNIDYMQFMKILFNPFALWDFGKLDAIVRGNAQQCPRKLGTSFSTQVYNSTDTPTR